MSRRLLVVSHPAVVSVNQEVYRELQGRGWDVEIVVPARWRHEFSRGPMAPQALEGMEGSLLHPTPVRARRIAPQRHVYLTRCGGSAPAMARTSPSSRPSPSRFVAAQWSSALSGWESPSGSSAPRTSTATCPCPVRWMRSRVLRDAAFVAARSETAGRLARSWGARGEVAFAPTRFPRWESPAAPTGDRPFTVGYAGRLVESKGLLDLLAAVREMPAPLELLLIGDGRLRPQPRGPTDPGLAGARARRPHPRADGKGFAQLDVLALPSRTTPTWKEQFGRVIVEALWCGVPVIGSDSGEIPWLIDLTGGGLAFPEGDAERSPSGSTSCARTPSCGRSLAVAGRGAVERLFSVPAATDPFERMLLPARRRSATTRG